MCGLCEFAGGDDHHKAQFLAERSERIVHGGRGFDAGDGLQARTDGAGAAKFFDRLLKVGADRADGFPLSEKRIGALDGGQRFEDFREDRFAFVGREDLERFFGGEGEDRRHQAEHRLRDVVKSRLGGAAGR